MKVLEIDGLKFGVDTDIEYRRASSLLTKEPGTIEWLNTLVSGDLLWDVGANIGVYSIYAAVKRGCRVFAFEPHLPSSVSLINNIKLNRCQDRVTVCSFALDHGSYTSGTAGFHYFSKRPGASGSQLYRPIDESGSSFDPNITVQVAIFSGEVLIENCAEFSNPTAMKIDTDGNEPGVFVGMRERIESLTTIQIEVRQQTKKIVDDLMERRGFELQKRHYTAAGEQRRRAGEDELSIPHNAIYRNTRIHGRCTTSTLVSIDANQ